MVNSKTNKPTKVISLFVRIDKGTAQAITSGGSVVFAKQSLISLIRQTLWKVKRSGELAREQCTVQNKENEETVDTSLSAL